MFAGVIGNHPVYFNTIMEKKAKITFLISILYFVVKMNKHVIKSTHIVVLSFEKSGQSECRHEIIKYQLETEL